MSILLEHVLMCSPSQCHSCRDMLIFIDTKSSWGCTTSRGRIRMEMSSLSHQMTRLLRGQMLLLICQLWILKLIKKFQLMIHLKSCCTKRCLLISQMQPGMLALIKILSILPLLSLEESVNPNKSLWRISILSQSLSIGPCLMSSIRLQVNG